MKGRGQTECVWMRSWAGLGADFPSQSLACPLNPEGAVKAFLEANAVSVAGALQDE